MVGRGERQLDLEGGQSVLQPEIPHGGAVVSVDPDGEASSVECLPHAVKKALSPLIEVELGVRDQSALVVHEGEAVCSDQSSGSAFLHDDLGPDHRVEHPAVVAALHLESPLVAFIRIGRAGPASGDKPVCRVHLHGLPFLCHRPHQCGQWHVRVLRVSPEQLIRGLEVNSAAFTDVPAALRHQSLYPAVPEVPVVPGPDGACTYDPPGRERYLVLS